MGSMAESAAKMKKNAAKNLHKSNNVVKNGNTRSKAALPAENLKKMQDADMEEQITSSLSGKPSETIVDKITGTTSKSFIDIIKDYIQDDEQ